VGSQDAYEDMFEVLTKNLQRTTNNTKKNSELSVVSGELSVTLHCYQADREMTQKFLALPNVYFSFTANITYPVKKQDIGTKNDLTETVKMVPLDRLFVETDCPFLSPQVKRGERNEPAFVVTVAEKVALLQGVSVSVIEEATEENFSKVFAAKN
jgi:TatD DNase family protein